MSSNQASDKPSVQPSILEEAITGLIEVFHTYSGKEGDKYKLSKLELKNLLQGELSVSLSCSQDHSEVEKIMAELDENQDGEVDFQEFVVLVSVLTITCNEFFKDFVKKGEATPCSKKV